jgi:hypothetical protein
MSSVFEHTVKYQARIPFSAADVANILIAIANRNDTPSRIEGIFSSQELHVKVVHLDQFVIAALFGTDVAFKYHETITNPAMQFLFRKVDEKLYAVGLALLRGERVWALSRLPKDGNGGFDVNAMYCLGDMFQQSPHGIVLEVTPSIQGKPSEHSVQTSTTYVTATLRK